MTTKDEIITTIKQAKSEHELNLINYDHVRTINMDPYLKALVHHKQIELELQSFSKRVNHD